jgi:hypothetical protein
MQVAPGTGRVREGVIIEMDDFGAKIVVGDGVEEWFFPTVLLPEGANLNDVVVLQGEGTSTRIAGTDSMAPSVESRMQRKLNRRRLALTA